MDPYTPTCGESYYDYAGRNVYQVHSQEAVCLGAGVREAGGAAPSGLSDRECVSPQRDAYLRVIEEDAGEEKCSESTLWIEPQSPLRVEIYPQDLNCELSGEPLVAVSVSVPTGVRLPERSGSFLVHLVPLDEQPLVVTVDLR